MSSTILLKNGTVLIHDEEDHVTPHYNTSILIKNDRISEIGNDITAAASQTIDCTGKMISPGFIDTHHHLWQTQLKGRHADEQLLEYFGSGNVQSYNYEPTDSFWGQLTGSLEAIDAGTTTVLDHHHGSYTQAHSEQVLSATIASGIRCILALSPVATLKSWTATECIPSQEVTLSWLLPYIEQLLQKPPLETRVSIGFGFDFFFLPQDYVTSIYTRLRSAGIKLITTHIAVNAVFGLASTTELLQSYNLLDKDILMSHGTGITDTDKQILYDHNIAISSTPETECQMGMGWPIALHPNVHGSLGVDCHSNNTSSILSQARMLLQMARQEHAVALASQGQYPRKVKGSTEQVFNLATIAGARAINMDNEIGSIKVGKKADLVIFNQADSVGMLGCRDPLTAVLRHSDIRDVEIVIVDGVLRKQHGKLVDVDVEGEKMKWKDVAREMNRSRERIYERMEKCNLSKVREMAVGMLGVDDGKLV